MSKFKNIFSLSKQFSNYYEYHKNPINQFIHFIFVPSIVFGVKILFTLKDHPIFNKIPNSNKLSYFNRVIKNKWLFYPNSSIISTHSIMLLLLNFRFWNRGMIFNNNFNQMVLFFQFFSFFLIANYISILPYVKNNFTFVCILIQVISWVKFIIILGISIYRTRYSSF
jgi:hypothetical protein